MKFAFVVNNYPPKMGGVERHASSLAQHLVAQGHTVMVHTIGPGVSDELVHGVRVRREPEYLRIAHTLGFPAIGYLRRLTRSLREFQPDVVSVHTRFFPMSFLGLLAARRIGSALVHTEHGSGHVAAASPIVWFMSRVIDLSVGRVVLRRADLVLGVSEETTAFVKRLAGVRAEVFWNAIEFNEPQEVSEKRPAHFVFVGRLIPGKGWAEVLRTVAALRVGGYQVTAEILGDGPDLEAARRLAQHLRVSDVVSLPGRVSPEAVRQSLRGATLVNATQLSEGFQTTLLEALAEGGRVLTYPVPGAQVLRELGAPITVLRHRDEPLLLSTAATLLGESWDALPAEALRAWGWAGRARQYAERCERLRRERVGHHLAERRGGNPGAGSSGIPSG